MFGRARGPPPFSEEECKYFENLLYNATLSTGLFIVSKETNLIRASAHPITFEHKMEKVLEKITCSYLTFLCHIGLNGTANERKGYDESSTKSPISSSDSSSSTSSNVSSSSTLTSSSGDTGTISNSTFNDVFEIPKGKNKFIFELEVFGGLVIITGLEKDNFDGIDIRKLKTMQSKGAKAYNCYFDLNKYIKHSQKQEEISGGKDENQRIINMDEENILTIKKEEEDYLIQSLNKNIFGHFSLKCSTVRDTSLKMQARKNSRQNVKYWKYFSLALATSITVGATAYTIHRLNIFESKKLEPKYI